MTEQEKIKLASKFINSFRTASPDKIEKLTKQMIGIDFAAYLLNYTETVLEHAVLTHNDASIFGLLVLGYLIRGNEESSAALQAEVPIGTYLQ